jgi:hypothetical protein
MSNTLNTSALRRRFVTWLRQLLGAQSSSSGCHFLRQPPLPNPLAHNPLLLLLVPRLKAAAIGFTKSAPTSNSRVVEIRTDYVTLVKNVVKPPSWTPASSDRR